jgi:hypothetical protein
LNKRVFGAPVQCSLPGLNLESLDSDLGHRHLNNNIGERLTNPDNFVKYGGSKQACIDDSGTNRDT